jgi:hypothetical protein
MKNREMFKGKSGANYFSPDQDFYKNVEEVISQKYGDESKAYNSIMGDVGTKFRNGWRYSGSSLFFAIEANKILPKNQRIASFDDFSDFKDLPLFDYASTLSTYIFPEIILRGSRVYAMGDANDEDANDGYLSYGPRRSCVNDLVNQVKSRGSSFSPSNPVRISDLEIIVDDNSYNELGFSLKLGEKSKIVNDKRIAYSS